MNREIVETFYTAFQKRDYETMKSCYHKEAVFQDEVFSLMGDDIGLMWQMLCTQGKDLEVIFTVGEDRENTVTANWEAMYSFSKTKRKVHNKIQAKFTFRDGKIIKHTDRFSFYRWSQMALGSIGYLLGWSPYLRKRVQKTALKSLGKFKKSIN